ncbi:MAG: transketolase [Patescibacteria group bacterium]
MGLNLTKLTKIANQIRRDVLTISYHGNIGHIGSALSVVDILTCLYFNAAKIYPRQPRHSQRDRIILSKGHACAALYSALFHKGFFSKAMLNTYHQDNTLLAGHPEIHLSGIDASSGSLGHGLSLASGMALAGKIQHRQYKVFAILSDGECDEGSVWEAALVASHRQLNNLIAIIDYNRLQAFGRTNQVVNLEPFKQKWQTFGWRVKMINGHNLIQIIKALNSPLSKTKPTVIICRTVLGKGVSFMEDKLEWHYLNPTQAQFNQAIKELKFVL